MSTLRKLKYSVFCHYLIQLVLCHSFYDFPIIIKCRKNSSNEEWLGVSIFFFWLVLYVTYATHESDIMHMYIGSNNSLVEVLYVYFWHFFLSLSVILQDFSLICWSSCSWFNQWEGPAFKYTVTPTLAQKQLNC